MATDKSDWDQQGGAPQVFDVDAEPSTVAFAMHRLGVLQVEGRFRRFEGTVHLDPEDLASTRLHLTIEAASVDTEDAERDERLRSSDLLDADTYDTITFHSTGVRDLDVNAFALDGELTLHGTTHAVTLDTTFLGLGHDRDDSRRALLFARSTIDRTDFGIEQEDGFRITQALVADEVQITLDLQAVQRERLTADG